MKFLKFLVVLLVVCCTVLAPVSAEPNPAGALPVNPPTLPVNPRNVPSVNPASLPVNSELLPNKTLFELFPNFTIDSMIFCSPIQRYLCCNGLPFRFIKTITDFICEDVRKKGCDDGTKDFCAANSFLDLVFIRTPLALFSYVKNIICCNNRTDEILASNQKAFCTNIVNVLCCKGVNIVDIGSVKDGFCEDPCIGYCKNNGTCTYDKVTRIPNCTCVDPYFGDRCELKCCKGTPYKWIKAADGNKPDNAFSPCDNGKCDSYVARALVANFPLRSYYRVVNLITADKTSYLATFSSPDKYSITPKPNYEVLNGTKEHLVWVRAKDDGMVPPNCSIQCARLSPTIITYFGRGLLKNTTDTYCPGEIYKGVLTFAYNSTNAYYYSVSDGFDYLTCVDITI